MDLQFKAKGETNLEGPWPGSGFSMDLRGCHCLALLERYTGLVQLQQPKAGMWGEGCREGGRRLGVGGEFGGGG